MGTHPIFESDFDCLTDFRLIVLSMVSESSLQQLKDLLDEKNIIVSLIFLLCCND